MTKYLDERGSLPLNLSKTIFISDINISNTIFIIGFSEHTFVTRLVLPK